jgi:hypothetical protein
MPRIDPRAPSRPCQALAYTLALAVVLAPVCAFAEGDDPPERPTELPPPAGNLVAVEVDDALPGPGFWIDEARLDWYLRAEFDAFDYRYRFEAGLYLDKRAGEYTAALERRVEFLERRNLTPGLFLGLGFALGIGLVVLTALAARGFDLAFDPGS